MWEIVRAGGWMMGPIILASIVAVAIILERLWTLQDRRVLPTDLTRRVWQLIEADQVSEKVIAALAQNSPLGKVLAAGLANRHRSREALMNDSRIPAGTWCMNWNGSSQPWAPSPGCPRS